jgi:hypothetical protein
MRRKKYWRDEKAGRQNQHGHINTSLTELEIYIQ